MNDHPYPIQHCWKSDADENITESWCGQPRDLNNPEHMASETMEEANERAVCSKCHRAVMHFKASPAAVEKTTMQMALFLNAVDVHESNTQPFVDMDPIGQEGYIKEAGRIVEAMLRLGWRQPRGEVV